MKFSSILNKWRILWKIWGWGKVELTMPKNLQIARNGILIYSENETKDYNYGIKLILFLSVLLPFALTSLEW